MKLKEYFNQVAKDLKVDDETEAAKEMNERAEEYEAEKVERDLEPIANHND